MSGRRRNRSDGNPTGTSGGVSGTDPGLDKSSSRSAGGRSSKMLKRKNVLLDGGFQLGNARGGRSHLRVGIGLVQRADEPGRPFLARHFRRVLFGLQIGLRDGDLFLRAAHLNVVQRHFRRQRHLRVINIFAGGLDGGVVGLKLPPGGAKKIQIPCRAQRRR